MMNDMPKFDYIIGNPPYDGNLHLKILDAIKQYGNKIIWLAPIQWMVRQIGHHYASNKPINLPNAKIRKVYNFDDNLKYFGIKLVYNAIVEYCDEYEKLDINDIRKLLPIYEASEYFRNNYDIIIRTFEKIVNQMKEKKISMKEHKKEIIYVEMNKEKFNLPCIDIGITTHTAGNQHIYEWDGEKFIATDNGKTRKQNAINQYGRSDVCGHYEFDNIEDAELMLMSWRSDIQKFITLMNQIDVRVRPELLLSDYTQIELTSDEMIVINKILKDIDKVKY